MFSFSIFKVLVWPFVLLTIVWRFVKYSDFASTVRVQVVRALGAKVGTGVRIRHGAMLKGCKNIVIGDNVYIGENTSLVAYGGKVRIGNDVLIADCVYVSSRNHRFRCRDVPIHAQGYKNADVLIEDDVWLAHGVVVLSGSEIRKGCIIGALLVAPKDTSSYTVYTSERVWERD